MALVGCNTVSKAPSPSMDKDIQHYIPFFIDKFLETTQSKKSKIFSVSSKYINEEVAAVSIVPRNVKIPIYDNEISAQSHIPSKHEVRNGKLFIWNDKNVQPTEDIVKVYGEFGILLYPDSLGIIHQETKIDETIKGVDYYFCRNNIEKYKREVTNIGFGYYPYPKLKCE